MAAVKATEMEATLVLPKNCICNESWKNMQEKYDWMGI
jgi:hypothetical protein